MMLIDIQLDIETFTQCGPPMVKAAIVLVSDTRQMLTRKPSKTQVIIISQNRQELYHRSESISYMEILVRVMPIW